MPLSPETYEPYTGNWQGSYMGWADTTKTMIKLMSRTLPGLVSFYMAGQWVPPWWQRVRRGGVGAARDAGHLQEGQEAVYNDSATNLLMGLKDHLAACAAS